MTKKKPRNSLYIKALCNFKKSSKKVFKKVFKKTLSKNEIFENCFS